MISVLGYELGRAKELLEAEYNPKDKFLTPAQMEIIIRHWKSPKNIIFLA